VELSSFHITVFARLFSLLLQIVSLSSTSSTSIDSSVEITLHQYGVLFLWWVCCELKVSLVRTTISLSPLSIIGSGPGLIGLMIAGAEVVCVISSFLLEGFHEGAIGELLLRGFLLGLLQVALLLLKELLPLFLFEEFALLRLAPKISSTCSEESWCTNPPSRIIVMS
jgi:hypothetical protein